MRIERNLLFLSMFLLLAILNTQVSQAQRGTVPVGRASGFTLFGDVEVTEEGVSPAKPLILDLLLYSRSGVLLDRQKVGSKGRYRFLNVPQGDYDIVVEFEGAEVARTHIRLIGVITDVRQDIALEWRSGSAPKPRPATISAQDAYDRREPNKDRFERAQEAFDKKQYDKAVALLTQIITDDPQDFQACSELGTVYMIQKNPAEAEKAYRRATEIRPTFFLALLNLGRLRLQQKSFDGAISALDRAITVQPTSAEANYLLGDAYLQIKKGSKAVGYLNEALKLDPVGKADAHLLLAALYNGAGLKEKAAVEYAEFLKKKPDYPDKKKLEEYIAHNKK